MKSNPKSPIYKTRAKRTIWTLDVVKQIALQYDSPSEWLKNHSRSYVAASRNKWFPECTFHMSVKIQRNRWTLEECLAVAKKYNTPDEWKLNHLGCYSSASRNGWFSQCTAHMVCKKRVNNYWNLETCLEEARKYQIPSQWKDAMPGSFFAAQRIGVYEQCIEHMKKRNEWTKERCRVEALKYTYRGEWQRESPASYNTATKKRWLDDLTTHMGSAPKKWTFEACKEIALKYNSRAEWYKANQNSYAAAVWNKWLPELTAHMGEPNSTKYTFETCYADAIKYKTKAEWKKKDVGSYRAALKFGWAEKCSKHMLKRGQKEMPEHTLAMCKKISQNYDSLYDWRLHSPRSFKDALKNGWIQECNGHMGKRDPREKNMFIKRGSEMSVDSGLSGM